MGTGVFLRWICLLSILRFHHSLLLQPLADQDGGSDAKCVGRFYGLSNGHTSYFFCLYSRELATREHMLDHGVSEPSTPVSGSESANESHQPSFTDGRSSFGVAALGESSSNPISKNPSATEIPHAPVDRSSLRSEVKQPIFGDLGISTINSLGSDSSTPQMHSKKVQWESDVVELEEDEVLRRRAAESDPVLNPLRAASASTLEMRRLSTISDTRKQDSADEDLGRGALVGGTLGVEVMMSQLNAKLSTACSPDKAQEQGFHGAGKQDKGTATADDINFAHSKAAPTPKPPRNFFPSQTSATSTTLPGGILASLKSTAPLSPTTLDSLSPLTKLTGPNMPILSPPILQNAKCSGYFLEPVCNPCITPGVVIYPCVFR